MFSTYGKVGACMRQITDEEYFESRMEDVHCSLLCEFDTDEWCYQGLTVGHQNLAIRPLRER